MVPAPSVIILTGPTASGKTALAIELAQKADPAIEIINADSMLVYRGMDIGTAKPAREEMGGIPHHLIDIRDPDQPFTAGDFHRRALETLEEIESRGRRALIAGGTGFYLKALTHGLWEAPKAPPELRARIESRYSSQELYDRLFAADPESALRIGVNDRYRLVRATELMELTGKTPSELQAATPAEPDPRFQLWVIDRDSETLLERITLRARRMLEQGLLDEVRRLHEKYPAARALGAVGYAECVRHLEGKAPEGRKIRPGLSGLEDEIILGTKQLVKRQRTWFRGQSEARWFELDGDRARLEEEFFRVYSRKGGS